MFQNKDGVGPKNADLPSRGYIKKREFTKSGSIVVIPKRQGPWNTGARWEHGFNGFFERWGVELFETNSWRFFRKNVVRVESKFSMMVQGIRKLRIYLKSRYVPKFENVLQSKVEVFHHCDLPWRKKGNFIWIAKIWPSFLEGVMVIHESGMDVPSTLSQCRLWSPPSRIHFAGIGTCPVNTSQIASWKSVNKGDVRVGAGDHTWRETAPNSAGR